MTQRIPYSKIGDRLSARYLNRIVDGANLALERLQPPRSANVAQTSARDIATDDQGSGELLGLGSSVFQENSRRTSEVRVEDPTDSSVFVDVDRIDEVTFYTARGERLTLTFNND